MSTKEYAVKVLASLSEDKMIEFVRLFADDNTIARMESELIENSPNRKRYNSFKEIAEEIEAEDG